MCESNRIYLQRGRKNIAQEVLPGSELVVKYSQSSVVQPYGCRQKWPADVLLLALLFNIHHSCEFSFQSIVWCEDIVCLGLNSLLSFYYIAVAWTFSTLGSNFTQPLNIPKLFFCFATPCGRATLHTHSLSVLSIQERIDRGRFSEMHPCFPSYLN